MQWLVWDRMTRSCASTEIFPGTSQIPFLAQGALLSTTGHFGQAHVHVVSVKPCGVNKNSWTNKGNNKSSPRVLSQYEELTYLLNLL